MGYPLTNSSDVSVTDNMYSYITSALFLFCATGYCWAVVELARINVIYEALITVVFLGIAIPFFKKADNWGDVKRLIILESIFNVICLFAKLAPLSEAGWSTVFDWLFALFFVGQVGGFLISQIKKKAWSCIPSSLAMGVALVIWFTQGSGTQISDQGGVHFWGGNAPEYLQLMYVFWVLNVLLVDCKQYLPKVTLLLVHVASVFIALGSDDFFHARILTASHLFVIGAVVMYKDIAWGGKRFATLPPLGFLNSDRPAAKTLPIIMSGACIATLLIGIATHSV